jgi:hypothetical protein
LPGPKTQIDTTAILSGQDRSPDEIKEYVRLFERFQRLRPDDGPDEIAKLIDLVENGTLKEECGNFVVRTSEEDYEMDQSGNRPRYAVAYASEWEPSSHNTARIQLSEFEDGYFSALTGGEAGNKGGTIRFDSSIPKDCAPLSGRAPFPWLQDTVNIQVGFRYDSFVNILLSCSEFDHMFGLSAPSHEEHLGTGKYF